MIEILHKCRDFLVCVKPQGLPSQPDTTGDEDMTSLLGAQLKEGGESSEIFVVHRLDRSTGGLILYARNKNAAAEFSRLVSEKNGFEKHYLAIVSGVPSEKSGNMTDYLFKDSTQKKAFVVKGERKGAKLASLDYEIIKAITSEEKTFSLLKIKLNTGRFHQIRAQLSSRGMPIYADGKYGSRKKAHNLALWASNLAFTYKGKKYEFQKEPDFDTVPWDLFE
ncbi:MAG: RNA pseudouridine synthase [Clostridia bacterium]|nr:RNA pseudouridine synthase [Clostridia bacterium]